MKKPSGKIIAFLFLLLLFSSCSPLKLKFSTVTPGNIENVALFSNYLGIQLPVLPLLDAAVMNEKTNSLSPEINDLMVENVSIMRETIAKSFHDRLGCNVIYGDALHVMPGYEQLKSQYNFEAALATGKEKFPYMYVAKGDFNPFNFAWPRTVQYFQTPANYQGTISTLCNSLNVDYILVSQSIILPQPGSIMIPASLYMTCELYLFDRKGTMLVNGHNVNTPPLKFKANDIEGYTQVLDLYSSILNPVIDKIREKYGK